MKKEKPTFCNLCQKSFPSNKLVSHLLRVHLPLSEFVCKKCDTEFTSVQDLQDHVNSDHQSGDDQLELSTTNVMNTFENSEDLIRHAKQSTNLIRYAFSFDSESALNKKELRSHIKNSIDEVKNDENSDFICKFCDNLRSSCYCCYCADNFLSKCHLKLHLLKEHVILPNYLKKFINFCDICKKIFTSEKYLSQHKKREHKTHQKKEKTSPFCHFCGKSLANKSNLKRHVLNQHSEEAGSTPTSCVFTCDYCKCFFSNKSSVKRHIENLHLREKDTRKSISCFQCEQRFNSIKNLNSHLTIEHHIDITETKLQFSNLTRFWEWKKEEEIRTNSRFIQLRGLRRQRRKGEEISTLKFVCNRSGIFHSKSNGKRAYRIKGSSKIGRYCSAYMEIMFKDNSSVNGTYCSTHSGHDNDLRYLTLTMDEKREIYEKIKNGATFSSILNEIRNSVGKEIKRKHLVTNKDLHNIVTTFKKLSKPSTESASESEQLSVNKIEYSIEPQIDRADRVFNNDLDICSDLWVETCQRMINRFDQTQPRSSVVDISKDGVDTRNVSSVKSAFVDDTRLQDDTNRLKNGMNLSPVFSRNGVPYGINNGYAPNGVPPGNLSQSYTLYSATESESRLNTIDIPYFNNVVTPIVSNNVRKEVPDFCGMQSISNDLRLDKDFYTSGIIPSTDNADRSVPNELCPNGFNALDTSNGESDDSSVYMRSIHVYDKVLDTNGETHSNIFNSNYALSEAQEQACEAAPTSPDEPDDNVADLSVSEDETSANSTTLVINQNTGTSGVSDLRDRVNSVTALYNIVESELDERKKNIIRNYVDNMFRVLQYRYNKCKTKKKKVSSKRTQQSLTEKKLSQRRRTNNDRSSRSRTTRKQKTKQSMQQKSVQQYSSTTHYASRNTTPYSSTLNNAVISNLRSDINLMRWDQY